MRRSSSLKVASVLAIASGWAPARLSATAATLTGPPESANNRRTARSTGVSLATRRAPARASTSLSASLSAVLITRFAKIGPPFPVEMRVQSVVTPDSRGYLGRVGHGRHRSDRHRRGVEAHRRPQRDEPLLRAGAGCGRAPPGA